MSTSCESKLPAKLQADFQSIESATRDAAWGDAAWDAAWKRFNALYRSILDPSAHYDKTPLVADALHAIAERDAKGLIGSGQEFLESVFKAPGFVLAACAGKVVLTRYMFELLYFHFAPAVAIEDVNAEQDFIDFARLVVKRYRRDHSVPTSIDDKKLLNPLAWDWEADEPA